MPHSLLEQTWEIFRKEPNLMELPSEGTLVCIGDTHGDTQASQYVIDTYLKPGYTILFLGDYIDRGEKSLENITLLLQAKLEHPEQVYLLQGNHEGWKAGPFFPCNFWESLNNEDQKLFADVLADLPMMATAENGLLACHGALPDVPSLESINEIKLGSPPWRQIVWGDWQDKPGSKLGSMGGRPQFGEGYFNELMERFGKTVLVRAHQGTVPLFLFDDRCVTLFTTDVYDVPRRITLIDLSKPLEKGTDMEVITLND